MFMKSWGFGQGYTAFLAQMRLQGCGKGDRDLAFASLSVRNAVTLGKGHRRRQNRH